MLSDIARHRKQMDMRLQISTVSANARDTCGNPTGQAPGNHLRDAASTSITSRHPGFEKPLPLRREAVRLPISSASPEILPPLPRPNVVQTSQRIVNHMNLNFKFHIRKSVRNLFPSSGRRFPRPISIDRFQVSIVIGLAAVIAYVGRPGSMDSPQNRAFQPVLHPGWANSSA